MSLAGKGQKMCPCVPPLTGSVAYQISVGIVIVYTALQREQNTVLQEASAEPSR